MDLWLLRAGYWGNDQRVQMQLFRINKSRELLTVQYGDCTEYSTFAKRVDLGYSYHTEAHTKMITVVRGCYIH